MVYRSIDNGATWDNVSSNGPKIDYVVNPNVWFIVEGKPGAYFDGSLIHLVYFKHATTDSQALVTHSSFNLATLGWSSEVSAAWSEDGNIPNESYEIRVCAWPGGGILAGWTEYNPSNDTIKATIGKFYSNSWSSISQVLPNTFSDSNLDGLAANTETGGAHVVLSVFGYLHYVPIASNMAQGSAVFVSGSNGGARVRDMRSWVYRGVEYVGFIWLEPQRAVAAVSSSASISLSGKTVYSRDEVDVANGASAVISPSGPSFHALVWWGTSPLEPTEKYRLRKSCFAYREGGQWTTPVKIAAHGESVFPSMIDGNVNGSTFLAAYSSGTVFIAEGQEYTDAYLNFLTESVSTCAAESCCCANIAY